MRLDIEWHIPWPAEWPINKKIEATERIVKYIVDGTMFESKHRAIAQAEMVHPPNTEQSPFIKITMER